MDEFTRTNYANIHRGVYTLSEEATSAYERARKKIAQFINARNVREVIYTRNTTESINLVARTWVDTNMHAGDTILTTEMEHHSNIVPWQLAATRTGVQVAYVPITDDGELDQAAYERLLEEKRPKLVALTQMSNVLGTLPPVREMIAQAHAVGALVLLDGAQAVPHHASGCTCAGLRLPGVQRPQDAWPDGNRRALGTPRTAGSDAAVPGWW